MPKGGARSRSGPLQDPNALRRNRRDDQAAWTTLPSEGRTGPAPEWPLTEATPRELVLWARWWAKPEAMLWGRGGRVDADYVALTVRMFAEAEVTKASAENRKTVRLMMADCFLTDDAKARARIRIAADETAQKREEKAAAPAKRTSARDRMKVVSSGDGA